MNNPFADFSPLRRFPQFRNLWLGYVVAQLGNQLTIVAVAYEIYRLTGSTLDVGFVSLAQLGPALIGSILGGSIADAIDRRIVLLVTNLSNAACAVGLALNMLSHHPQIWLFYVFAGISAGFVGVDGPTRTALMMTLVDRQTFVAANVLRQLLQQTAAVAGPAVAGVIVARFGVETAFWTNVVTFSASIAAILTIKKAAPVENPSKFGLKSIAEGFRFLRAKPMIRSCFIADSSAMVFGMPTAVFPALAIHHFGGGASTLGLLYAAPSAGAFLGALFAGWSAQVRHPGRAVFTSISVWGIGIALFGLSPWLWPGLACLAIAGWADVVSATFRNTILQFEAPDRLRGRLSSIHTAVVTSGPRLGNVEAGVAAAIGGSEFSVVSGGLACLIAVAIMAKRNPAFIGYELPIDDEPATAAVVPPARGGEGPAANEGRKGA